MKFIRGDRVFIVDRDPISTNPTPRERLGMVTGEVERQPGQDELTYTLSVPGVNGQSDHSTTRVAEADLEPAGALGERYEQVVGPYNDFMMIWTQAIRLGKRSTLSRDIDIIGISWPDWFLLVEIRGSGVEVPLVRDHADWRWHMAVAAS